MPASAGSTPSARWGHPRGRSPGAYRSGAAASTSSVPASSGTRVIAGNVEAGIKAGGSSAELPEVMVGVQVAPPAPIVRRHAAEHEVRHRERIGRRSGKRSHTLDRAGPVPFECRRAGATLVRVYLGPGSYLCLGPRHRRVERDPLEQRPALRRRGGRRAPEPSTLPEQSARWQSISAAVSVPHRRSDWGPTRSSRATRSATTRASPMVFIEDGLGPATRVGRRSGAAIVAR